MRFLYLTGRRGFLCRKCARLNYKSQQQTKDGMVDYWKGMEYAKKYLTLPPWPIDGFSFLGFRPDKPKGMHERIRKEISDPPAVAYRWIFLFGFSSR